MIQRQPTPNRLRILIALAPALSLVLTAPAAEPTTRPTTRQTSPKAPVDNTPEGKIRAALPAGWSLQGTARIARTDLHPGLQWSPVPTGYVKLRSPLVQTKEGMQRAAPPIVVWIAHRQAQKARWKATENQQDIELKTTEYLGLGSGYHVYVHLPAEAKKLWPEAPRDIAKALGVKIKTPTTRPADVNEKSVRILITQKGDAISYTVDGVDHDDIKALGQTLTKVPKDSRLHILIETNVPVRRVAEVMAVARKLHLMRISISVVRTSPPPAKPGKPEKLLDL